MTAMFAALCALAVLTAQAVSSSPTALTLDDAFARAEAANLSLRAARLVRAIGAAETAVARELPNPEARVELERETPKQAYGLALPIELGGKRARRISVSEAALNTSDAQIRVTALDTRAAVRRAYFGRVVADARVTLLDEVTSIAARAQDAAQQRFDAGSAPRLEVLQAQLALSQARNDAATARADAAGARAELNVLLGLPIDAQPVLATPLGAGPTPGVAAALTRAEEGNAELALLRRRVEEARARIALARSLRVPDVTPEAVLTREAEPEFNTGWRAAVAMSIPLFATHMAGVRVEEATLAQVEAEEAAARARVAAAVTAAAAAADARQRQFARYRDEILPQAAEVERMAQDSYTLGQTGIAALLQALQATRDVRLRMLQAATDFHESSATLERAMGVPLP
jgi:cobalt-zinc-cadmium efflux system outer membrane protein